MALSSVEICRSELRGSTITAQWPVSTASGQVMFAYIKKAHQSDELVVSDLVKMMRDALEPWSTGKIPTVVAMVVSNSVSFGVAEVDGDFINLRPAPEGVVIDSFGLPADYFSKEKIRKRLHP